MGKSPAITVRPVSGRGDLRAFIRLPHAIYADDPAWIAPLEMERRMHLSARHNPFFEHGEAQLFLAFRAGRPVGRISAQVDRLHLERHDDSTGFFGFLEGVDDADVFRALLTAAEDWLRARGMRRARGPFSFSINEESGLLVDGFAHPPAVMMGHARPWYDAHVRAAGYRKVMDLIAYDFDERARPHEKASALSRRLRARGTLRVRRIRMRALREELRVIMEIFNDAWSGNWGFVPFTESEIRKLGDDFRRFVDERHVSIAMWNGEPAAFAVLLPDLNRWIADFRGRLLPFNWLRLLWRARFAGPPAHMRMPLMGVRRRFHGSTIGAALAFAVIDDLWAEHRAAGVRRAELSWVLETNTRVRHLIESLGGRAYKTYRVYERELREA